MAILEDACHGFGHFEIRADMKMTGDRCHIEISSQTLIPCFIISHEGNSYSGVYPGPMMFAQLPPPDDEGLYLCVTGNMGPKVRSATQSRPRSM